MIVGELCVNLTLCVKPEIISKRNEQDFGAKQLCFLTVLIGKHLGSEGEVVVWKCEMCVCVCVCVCVVWKGDRGLTLLPRFFQ